MSGMIRQGETPGESPTDQAAGAAFDAIDARLRALGLDPDRAWSVVMVLFPDGKPANATVAGNLPGDSSSLSLLQHALTQLEMLAAECGYKIVAQPVSN